MNGLPKTMQITLPPPFPLEAGRDGLKQAFRMFWGRHSRNTHDRGSDSGGRQVVTRLRANGRH